MIDIGTAVGACDAKQGRPRVYGNAYNPNQEIDLSPAAGRFWYSPPWVLSSLADAMVYSKNFNGEGWKVRIGHIVRRHWYPFPYVYPATTAQARGIVPEQINVAGKFTRSQFGDDVTVLSRRIEDLIRERLALVGDSSFLGFRHISSLPLPAFIDPNVDTAEVAELKRIGFQPDPTGQYYFYYFGLDLRRYRCQLKVQPGPGPVRLFTLDSLYPIDDANEIGANVLVSPRL